MVKRYLPEFDWHTSDFYDNVAYSSDGSYFAAGSSTVKALHAFDEKNNRLVVSEHGGIGPETDTYCNQNGGWSVRNYGPNTSIYAFDLNGTLLNS